MGSSQKLEIIAVTNDALSMDTDPIADDPCELDSEQGREEAAKPDPPPISHPTIPRVVARSEHCISRANISQNALKVLYRLKQGGYQSYLVGGGVRDLLLGREPKDFDIATDATPEQVRAVFNNCRLIGRRFRLAHVHFGGDIIEVATFRGSGADVEADDGELRIENGMIVRDNVYGTREEDALRRDFTINALYYNIADFSLIDYAGGLDDLNAGTLRLIGDDPERRYREDPVRMLRAVRFACKLGFRVEPACEAPLSELGDLLSSVPRARLFDEILKLFHGGCAVSSFEMLRHYALFGWLFPATEACLAEEEQGFPNMFVTHGLESTDLRIQENKSVSPAFLFAVLLWEPVRRAYERLIEDDVPAVEAMLEAASRVLSEQQTRVAIPKRFTLPMREIWTLQPRLVQRQGKRPFRLLGHPQFRSAFDFLLLRAKAGEIDQEHADWWSRFIAADGEEREGMTQGSGKRRRRKRRATPKEPVKSEST